MAFFGNMQGIMSLGGAWPYLTFALLLLFLILVLFFLAIKGMKGVTKYKLSKFLEKQGIPVEVPVEEKRFYKDPQKVYFEIPHGAVTSEEEIKVIGGKLREVLGNEKLLEQKDRLLSEEIKRLHQMVEEIETVSSKKPEEGVKDQKQEDSQKAQDAPKQTVQDSLKKENPKQVELNATQEAVDNDIKQILIKMDNLLEKLPEEEIDKFVSSEDFKVYQKVIERAKKQDGSI